ncbi:hypothetical protein ACLEJW_01845 [Pseudomonas sp. SMSB3]|uniref:hypothetical protein n=1 Tax=unclassified Pseudomonas TaxID=196821 RepID=UPI0028AD656F|nr:hypothetical protein [Pseudomonas sp.]
MPLSLDALVQASVRCSHPSDQLAAFAKRHDAPFFQNVLRAIYGPSPSADYLKLHAELCADTAGSPTYQILNAMDDIARYDGDTQTIQISAAAVEQAQSQASATLTLLLALLKCYARHIAYLANAQLDESRWPEACENYVGTMALFDRLTNTGTVIAVIEVQGASHTITLELPTPAHVAVDQEKP